MLIKNTGDNSSQRHTLVSFWSTFLTSPVCSDPEECCRAAGVCCNVQCGAAETLLSAVHGSQHGCPAWVQVSMQWQSPCLTLSLHLCRLIICKPVKYLACWLFALPEWLVLEVFNKYWCQYLKKSSKCVCKCFCLPFISHLFFSFNISVLLSEHSMFSVMKCSSSSLLPTDGWWVSQPREATQWASPFYITSVFVILSSPSGTRCKVKKLLFICTDEHCSTTHAYSVLLCVFLNAYLKISLKSWQHRD